MDDKKITTWKVFFWFLIGFYYTVRLFLISFPILIAVFVIPDVGGFLKELGNRLEWNPDILMIGAYVCAAINGVFLIWHFLIKRYRTNIFDNKFFYYWLCISNTLLFFWLTAVIFGNPIYSSGGPMGK